MYVLLLAADGTSDDTDVPIKKLFMDAEFVQKYNLGSLNSVNWCRMMIQIAHHFYSYFQVCLCYIRIALRNRISLAGHYAPASM